MKIVDEIDFDLDPLTSSRKLARKLGRGTTPKSALLWHRTVSAIDSAATELEYASRAPDLNAVDKAAVLRKKGHLLHVGHAMRDLYYSGADGEVSEYHEEPTSPESPLVKSVATHARSDTQILELVETLFQKTDDAVQSIYEKFESVDSQLAELKKSR